MSQSLIVPYVQIPLLDPAKVKDLIDLFDFFTTYDNFKKINRKLAVNLYRTLPVDIINRIERSSSIKLAKAKYDWLQDAEEEEEAEEVNDAEEVEEEEAEAVNEEAESKIESIIPGTTDSSTWTDGMIKRKLIKAYSPLTAETSVLVLKKYLSRIYTNDFNAELLYNCIPRFKEIVTAVNLSNNGIQPAYIASLFINSIYPKEFKNFISIRLKRKNKLSVMDEVYDLIEQYRIVDECIKLNRPTSVNNEQPSKNKLKNAVMSIGNDGKVQSKPIWPSCMCLGCGHTTSPPHRRYQCPHKHLPGFCAVGVCRTPIDLTKDKVVASIKIETNMVSTLKCDNVANFNGQVSVANINKKFNVCIGLDTYSCATFINTRFARQLLLEGISFTVCDTPFKGVAAGGGILFSNESIDLLIHISEVQCKLEFELNCKILDIPGDVDILIGYCDILDKGLQKLFVPCNEVVHSVVEDVFPKEPPSPEEEEEKFDDVTYGVTIPNDSVDISPAKDIVDMNVVNNSLKDELIKIKDKMMDIPADLVMKTLESFPCIKCVEKEQVICIANVLLKHQEVLSPDFPIGGSTLPPMSITLLDKSTLPVSPPPRRQSPVVEKFINETIVELLNYNFIERKPSFYASPIVVARAPGRNWRLCIDYSSLNKITEKLQFPLPNIRELLFKMSGYHCYCTLDLRKGFHQIKLEENSRMLSAFMAGGSCYVWNVVPFGLQNAPAYFQFVLSSIVLVGLIGSCCCLYIDDIIIGGNDIMELSINLDKVLSKLKEYKLLVNLNKCAIGSTTIQYLGHLLSGEGVAIADMRKEALFKINAPNDIKSLRSFLGLCNYFRDFIPNYSAVSACLYDVASTRKEFIWSPDHQKTFDSLKNLICNSSMLHHLDYNYPIVLRTDASSLAIGATIIQVVNDKERIIIFGSKKLSPAARRWSTRDQEAYAVYYFINLYAYYLKGHPFTVEKDHKNLAYISKSKDGRVYRWKIALQEFDFIVKHIPGKSNEVADALSRCVLSIKNNYDNNNNNNNNCCLIFRTDN